MTYYYEPFWTADYEKSKLPSLQNSGGVQQLLNNIWIPTITTFTNTNNDYIHKGFIVGITAVTVYFLFRK